ncbi:MAG: cell surface protein SprA, partial [Calditrichaeota bacterium]|nr:cell surface protein SprA [Calditrichota bacterium]
PKNPQPTDLTWNLMFRHVYSLNAQDIDPNNFKMEIVRSASSSNIPETSLPGLSETYLTTFRFDLEDATGGPTPDGKVDNYPALIRYDRGEIHFQDLTPFCPSGFWDGSGGADFITYPLPDSGSYMHCDLYTKTESIIRSQSAFWSFNTEFRGSRSVYDLGPLVLEGSEEVILNGVHLTRGVDYTIDYMSGQLRILNQAAKAENADLEILYESGTIFQLERKTLLGMRAEYALWENSYIGGMWLYLNEKPLERRVRVGSEPIRNTLYDMNTSLTFRPYFLTRAVDMLPLVVTETPSEIKVDAEVARVYPNPNSMENRATGDVGGLAYLDDFESARRSVPLGLLRRQWSLSSIPSDARIDSLRGRMIWYNPTVRSQVPVREVFPEREVNENVANTLQSLNIIFRPDLTEGDPERSWGGLMRYLGEAYADQTLSKYLEIWVKWDGQDEGRLVVDIGQISEDALPDGQMSTEDRPEPGQPQPGDPSFDPRWEYGNGIINGPHEDTGLDGIALPDPQDSAYWNGPTRPKVPSWDDWAYSAGSDNFENINGSQGNLNDESGNYPDTEDLNNNQVLDIQNNYFSYNFWLSDTSHYIAGGQTNPYGWRLFRIPLSNYNRIVGNPSMTQIRSVRLYLTGISSVKHVELVQLDIVGNEWQQIFVGDSTERISAAVINNHENPGYKSPPGVQGEIDPISGVRTKEQSLAISIHELFNNPHEPHLGEAWIAKNLYTYVNLLEY